MLECLGSLKLEADIFAGLSRAVLVDVLSRIYGIAELIWLPVIVALKVGVQLTVLWVAKFGGQNVSGIVLFPNS